MVEMSNLLCKLCHEFYKTILLYSVIITNKNIRLLKKVTTAKLNVFIVLREFKFFILNPCRNLAPSHYNILWRGLIIFYCSVLIFLVSVLKQELNFVTNDVYVDFANVRLKIRT